MSGTHQNPPGTDPTSAEKFKEKQMSITRRKFLKAGTLVALSAAIPLRVSGQQPRKVNDGNPIDQSKDVAADPLSTYTRATFSSYLNSIFRLYTGYSTVDVALVEVMDLIPGTSNPQTGTPEPAKTNPPAHTNTTPKKTKPSKRRGGDEDFFEGVIN